MKAVMPVRRALRLRTIFNLLGPLTNPAGVRSQLVGVYEPSRCEPMAQALIPSGVQRALVVSAACGLDEIAPAGVTHVAELRYGVVSTYAVTPADFGLEEAPLESIRGGEPATNAAILRAILSGEPHPARTGVLLNAGAALMVVGASRSFAEGAAAAAALIDSGRAAAKLADIAAAGGAG
jgi:anthranilate phosphoribosyltransferase